MKFRTKHRTYEVDFASNQIRQVAGPQREGDLYLTEEWNTFTYIYATLGHSAIVIFPNGKVVTTSMIQELENTQ